MKPEIVKRRLLYVLGEYKKSYNKIYARNCNIKEISPIISSEFLDKYHIQGKDKSNIRIGAFYKNKLVAVMTFGKQRKSLGTKSENDFYEMYRFCSDENLIMGIAGKMFSYFIKTYNPKKIISFGDVRWVLDSNCNMYTKLGFNLTKILPPDYKYYNTKIHRYKRFHKFGFGKNNLKKRLEPKRKQK